MNVIVTGGAGFIGSHLCDRLLQRGDRVIVIDSFDPFYDPQVKRKNLAAALAGGGLHLIEADIRDHDAVVDALARFPDGAIDVLVHLAARPGVRPSLQQPTLYSEVNLTGTVVMLELARRLGIRRFIFGSSSSIYGNNAKVPFAEADPVERPISPYAATKRAGELLCHTYHHLYGLSVLCLRFFTVYGPRQRPDLAIHKFARLMAAGKSVPMYGDGRTERDYTYVDDIVHGIERAIEYTAAPERHFEVLNLGESRTVPLVRVVELLGEAMGIRPAVEHLPMQPGDVQRTFADVTRARELLGYDPKTPIEEGIPRFVEWFRRASAASRAGVPTGCDAMLPTSV